MRLCHTGLVVAAVFLAISDVTTDSKTIASRSTQIFADEYDRVLSQRFLRAEHIANDGDEERAFSTKSIPGLDKVLSLFKSKITPGTIENWVKNGKSSDYVFLKLKLDKVGYQLFDNPDINVWNAYTRAVVKTNPDDAMLSVLKARYTDDTLSKMFEAGKKAELASTKSVATNLQTQQMENWLAAKKTPDDVFKVLLLDKAGDSILDSPVLAAWTNYMKFFNSKPENTKNRASLMATLTTHYTDRGVLNIIEAAKKVPSTAPAAKRLEAEQIQFWLKKGRTPDDLSTLVPLDMVGDQLLANPRFQTWSKFINYYNKENLDEATTVLAKLTHHLGDEKLTPILVAARKVPSTEIAATNLQTEQFKSWLGANTHPDDVFKLLQLEKAGDDLLTNPQFSYWLMYVEDFNLKAINNDKKQASTIRVVRDNFDDDVLANMVLAGKKVPNTQKMAQRLESDLFKGWMNNGNSPDDVFMHLKLNEAGDNVFQSPFWNMYTDFLAHYNKVFPKKPTTMISALRGAMRTRSYEDEALAKILISAKEVPSTAKLATKLQADQIQHWLASKDPPDEIFNALMVDEAVEDVLTSPLFKIWNTYFDEFNTKFPSKKASMINAFRTTYDDEGLAYMLVTAKKFPVTEELATKLQAEQLKAWLTNKDTPEDVFKALMLNGAVDDVLTNPLLTTWTTYLDAFDKKFPKAKVSMIDTFREYFGDEALVKMLMAAKKDTNTRDIATSLEGSLINTWILAKKTPATISKLLGTDAASAKFVDDYTSKFIAHKFPH